MSKNKYLVLTSALLCTISAYANQEVLGDSNAMGLDNEPTTKTPKNQGNPNDKVSDLGHGAYVRQYKDFGQPMVEVHPENGPSYYYNENEIQQPNPNDGVHFREAPQWMLKQW